MDDTAKAELDAYYARPMTDQTVTDLEADDLEALREALDFYRHGSPATSHFNTIKDAARKFLHLMEGAETVWSCEVHKHTGEEAGCLLRWHPMFDDAEDGRCRMVKAVLIILGET